MDCFNPLRQSGLSCPEVEELLPIPEVSPNEWGEQVVKANAMAELIDLHLDHEAKGRMLIDRQDFTPTFLCPEQRIQMVSDLYAATRA